MASGDNDSLKAGPISKVIMPVTALGLVLMLTVYVLYTELVLEEPGADFQPPVAERPLTFIDQEDGEIVVQDGRDGETLETIEEGEQSFMRQTVRQLARARTRTGGSEEVPFMLRGLEDGRLILEDPVTGQAVDLAAFGKTNAGAFARFLENQGGGESGAEGL
ncbi:MAG: photosynthetic complex assembly protein PuhC [Halorhodospira sp.]